MWRFGFDATSSYILIVALLTFLVAILVWQRQRTGKTLSVWFFSALIGILLGSVGSYALMRTRGYELAKMPEVSGGVDVGLTEDDEEEAGDEGGMGGGMPGGGRGGGMGGFGGPNPKRDLASLVRKINLLTGDVGLSLTDEQATSLLSSLEAIETAEALTDDEAQAKHDEILALLDDQQKPRLDAVGLPRSSGRRGGPGGGGPEGGEPDPDANPFSQEQNASAVSSLRERFGDQEDSSEESATPKEDSSEESATPEEDSSEESATPKEDSSKESATPEEDSSEESATPKEDSSKESATPEEDSSEESATPKEDSSKESATPEEDSSEESATPEEDSSGESATPEQ